MIFLLILEVNTRNQATETPNVLRRLPIESRDFR